jgi:endonuclease YncB( thermonuclease family)
MRAVRRIFHLLVLLCAALPASAAPGDGRALTQDLKSLGSATAVEIVDGDTLLLDDGREVRLVGIQAPKLPLGRAGFTAWPLAEEAKAALAELAIGRTLELRAGGRDIDRHGRVLAHLVRDDGLWLQGELLRRGLARVYSFADNRALVPEMLALEQEARAADRGIWLDPYYAVLNTAAAEDTTGGFRLVEGRIVAVAVVHGRAYLNFGADWKTDFTITLAPAVRKRFLAEGLDPETYEGRKVRVRGWLKSFNGPMIEVTHPEQIELLPE